MRFRGLHHLGVGGLLIWNALVTCAADAPVSPTAAVHVVLPPDELARLQREATAGSVDAQLELALAYDAGTAGKRDQVEAAQWYERAAAQNVGVAHLRLGMLQEAGTGLQQDYVAARVHYEKAVAAGVPEANLRLGILYLEGWGAARDPALAVATIEKAAEAGYRPAQSVLSDMYAGGVGVKRDPVKAVAWAERMARQKDPEGEIRLGVLALGVQGLKEDRQLAREWFQLSAQQEYSDGMLAMAATFLRPDRTPEDAKLGVRWLELAVDNGNSAAAFYLGAQLAFAAGNPPDQATEVRIRELLEQSARAGESSADEVLELAKDGSTWQEAFRHVLTVPYERRYVQRAQTSGVPLATGRAGDSMPVVVKIVRPIYPRALRLTHTTGEVLVDFVVDVTGRVRNPFVVRSAHEAFSDHALVAVRQWVFVPGIKDGHLAAYHMQVPVVFEFSEVNDARAKRSKRTPAVGAGER
ncbi:MAG: TonB family protein [Verrucomicrobia bacterium]|nr:TonB family protein [Verrucomicrobiota bacterium]